MMRVPSAVLYLLWTAMCVLLGTIVTIEANSLVLSSDNANHLRSKRNPGSNVNTTVANIVQFSVTSEVYSRMANVAITSVLDNHANEAREAEFVVYTPDSAFISNFTMLINDTLIVAQVFTKEEAQQQYEAAKNQSQSTGQVRARGRDQERGMDIFTISVNAAANSQVTFQLNYIELLERRLGYHTQTISIRPGQVVDVLTIDVAVHEPQGVSEFMYALPGQEKTFLSSSRTGIELRATGEQQILSYNPGLEVQRAIGTGVGINGDFIIKYDVTRTDEQCGQLWFENDYVVQYFSMNDLPNLAKNVMFVIDISGSMSGQKISQTRDAMLIILEQLSPGDFFNIILFDSVIQQWNNKPVVASANNIDMAKQYVLGNVHARGSTNINDALLSAIVELRKLDYIDPRGEIVIFLTDGQPTAGETYPMRIRENIKRQNEGQFAIFSLGFGEGVNFPFLEYLSWENNGFARRIYLGYDVVQQLEGFFEEIRSPLLKDIQVVFKSDTVIPESVTDNRLALYFKGTEFVVAAQLQPGSVDAQWRYDVVATGKNAFTGCHGVTNYNNMGSSDVVPDCCHGFAEKLWAYKTIKDLLRRESTASDTAEKQQLKSRALELSLKYNMVTPLTSMVVTQSMEPDSTHESMDKSYGIMAPQSPGISHNSPPQRNPPMAGNSDMTVYNQGPSSVVSGSMFLLPLFLSLLIINC